MWNKTIYNMTFSVRISHTTKQSILNWILLVILAFGVQELYKEESEYWSENLSNYRAEQLAKQYDISELLSTQVKYNNEPASKIKTSLNTETNSKSKILLTKPSCKTFLTENDILVGRKIPSKLINTNPTWNQVQNKLTELEVTKNGCWEPSDCYSEEKLIIIIPYRNREQNLKQFLIHMHEFLQKQRRNYCIKVIEQASYGVFNRAKLMNVGYDMRLF